MDKAPDGNNRKNRLKSAAAAGLLCFALVAGLVLSERARGFDAFILGKMYALRNPALNSITVFITCLGNWQTVTAIGAALLIFSRARRYIGMPFAVTSLSSVTIYKLLKVLFKRQRPDAALRLISQGGFSFPSGHSMNCIVAYGLLIYFARRYVKNKKAGNVLAVLLMPLILFIGLSRIYLGVHFPTDILGGWSMGLAILCVSVMILDRR